MSSKSGVSTQDIIQNLDEIKVNSLKENSLLAMNNKSNETTSLYTLGNRMAGFFVDRGQMAQYPDFTKLVEPKFVNALYGTQNVKAIGK
jgi:hypothetical protein